MSFPRSLSHSSIYSTIRLLAFSWIASLACGTVPRGAGSDLQGRSVGSAERFSAHSVLLLDTFDRPDAIRDAWTAEAPKVEGAGISIDNESARVVLPSYGEARLKRLIDTAGIGRARIRVSVRVHSDSKDAVAQIGLSTGNAAPELMERVLATTVPSASWSELDAVVDFAEDVRRAELSLVFRGSGRGWFDDLKIEVLAKANIPRSESLSSQQLLNIEALAHATSLIRYRHPSDGVILLDWNKFLPVAVARVLSSKDRDALQTDLSNLFASIAPMVEFSSSPQYSKVIPAHRQSDHLVRWRHVGLGSRMPYVSWREGTDADEAIGRIETTSTSNLSQCKKARLHALARLLSDEGGVSVYAEVDQPGLEFKRFTRRITSGDSSALVEIDVPPNAYRIRLGIEMKGRASVKVETLSLQCEGQAANDIDLRRMKWDHLGINTLYSHKLDRCNSRLCLEISRLPLDFSFDVHRDVVSKEISPSLWVHVPLALWSRDRGFSENRRTLESQYGSLDLPTRLAVVTSAWCALSLFYPYFSDLHINWPDQLRPALMVAASARTEVDVHNALASLLAKLRDNHARVIHPAFPIDGVLPVALRKFGDKLVIVGVLNDYAKAAPVGAEVLSIDGKPAALAYNEMRERVSAATEGWADYVVPFWLTLGTVGRFSTMRIKTESGEVDLALPHLPRDIYDSLVREHRPAFGASLGAGIYYVDLEGMKIDRWRDLLPTLSQAQAVILDMRGYPGNAVFTMIGHFINTEVKSPSWQVPLLESGGYHSTYWTIRPAVPRLKAKLIVLVDGRAGSAAETFLQIIRDNGLAILVGEASAGTNGNIAIVPLPGGVSMRFTGMRVPLNDGRILHGRGIEPDRVVHPTLQGVREGRDQILEEAVDIARGVVSP